MPSWLTRKHPDRLDARCHPRPRLAPRRHRCRQGASGAAAGSGEVDGYDAVGDGAECAYHTGGSLPHLALPLCVGDDLGGAGSSSRHGGTVAPAPWRAPCQRPGLPHTTRWPPPAVRPPAGCRGSGPDAATHPSNSSPATSRAYLANRFLSTSSPTTRLFFPVRRPAPEPPDRVTRPDTTGASVQTGKTLKPPRCVPCPTCNVGIIQHVHRHHSPSVVRSFPL